MKVLIVYLHYKKRKISIYYLGQKVTICGSRRQFFQKLPVNYPLATSIPFLLSVLTKHRKIKSATVCIVSPSICHKVLGPDWCWNWNSNTLATSWEELTHWKRLWCWEGLGAGGEDHRGWDGWMASPTLWTWVWVNSGSWWWTGRPGVLLFMGLQRVGHDWVTELNWTELRRGKLITVLLKQN